MSDVTDNDDDEEIKEDDDELSESRSLSASSNKQNYLDTMPKTLQINKNKETPVFSKKSPKKPNKKVSINMPLKKQVNKNQKGPLPLRMKTMIEKPNVF